jgi:hypothetical protein
VDRHPQDSRDRRVTAPRRRFGPEQLAELGRKELRPLAQLLLHVAGAQIEETRSTGHYDEWLFRMAPVWRSRRARARLHVDAVGQDDVDRLEEVAVAESDSETLLIAPQGAATELNLTDRIHLVGPDELIGRLERSPLVRWEDGRPVAELDRLATLQELDELALLDPVGIRWLPSLALNELPPDLEGASTNPEELLERSAFRLFTASLRFRGERYGTRDRGARLPDALLLWPCGASAISAMLDCKAASAGYTMTADHVLRFERYASELRREVEDRGYQLRYMVVLSSSFPGSPGDRHPFHGRAAELRERAGVELVYVRAEDVSRIAARIESIELPPAKREAIPWAEVFDQGFVDAAHLQDAVSKVTS